MPPCQEDMPVQHVCGGPAGRRRHPAQRAQRQQIRVEMGQQLQARHASAAHAAAAAAGTAAARGSRRLWLLAWRQFQQRYAAIPAAHQ